MNTANKYSQFESVLRSSIQWIQESPDEKISQNYNLLKEFKHSYYKVKRLKGISKKRMSVGVYGASQAGKSYFVSSLVRNDEGKINVLIDGKEVNFLEKINPQGGKEATAIVTRFTKDNIDLPNSKFPIRINIINEFDLIKILINSFYNDIEFEQVDDLNVLVQTIQDKIDSFDVVEIENDLSSEEFYFIENYCERRFRDQVYFIALKKTNFWAKAPLIFSNLSQEDRARFLEILWGGIISLTDLYTFFLKQINKLNGCKLLYCPTTVLFDQINGDFERKNESIINVSILKSIFEDNAEYIEVFTEKGEVKRISFSILGALASEISFSLSGNVHDFFNFADLLDFPGARSRHRVQADKVSGSDQKIEHFLRGKISYLFENYTNNLELTALLLCVGPSNQEVVGLDRTIEEWIENLYGARPETREGQQNSLFLVLTKVDDEFKVPQGAGISSSRWDTRIIASIEEPFGASRSYRTNWLENWTPTENFKNCFWFRSPYFDSMHLVKKGYDTNGNYIELELENSRSDSIEKIIESYSKSEKITKYFDDADIKLSSSLKLNDGGSGIILDRLNFIAGSEFRSIQIKSLFFNEIKMRHSDLRRFFITSDVDQLISQKRLLSEEITKEFGIVFKKHRLGQFIFHLNMKEERIREIFSQTLDEVNSKRYSRNSTSSDAPLLNTEDLVLLGLENAASPMPEVKDTTHSEFSSAFVYNLIEDWSQGLRKLLVDRDYGLYFSIKPEIVYDFLNEIEIFALNSGLISEISNIIEKDQYISTKANLELNKAALITAAVNSFLCSAGMNRRTSNVIELLNGEKRTVFKPANEFDSIEISESISNYDREYLIDWILSIQYLVRNNVSGELRNESLRIQNSNLGILIDQIGSIIETSNELGN